MKPLIKLIIYMFVFFSIMFLAFHLSGILNMEQIKKTMLKLHTISPWWVFTGIIFLLWIDLFIAVPTLGLTILSGYLLGSGYGFLTASIGMMSSGVTGYIISKRYGKQVFHKLITKEKERLELQSAFRSYGVTMIILSRAMPILPEVTSCLAGITRTPFLKYMAALSASSLPYAFVASYAGSISSLDNPKPALFIGLGISLTLWLGWFVFSKKLKKS